MAGMGTSGHGGGDDDLIASINITPLVDVVLVLLIIFLITAPVIYQNALKVELPQAKTGESSQASPLAFTIDREGKVTWGGELLNWASIEERVKAKETSFKNETASIRADTSTPHGTVIQLMDILRAHGILKFALDVDPGKK